MPSRPFSECSTISRSRGQIIRDQRRQADAEIHVSAVGNVARDARGELLAVELLHGAASVLRNLDEAVDENAGRDDRFGIELAELDDLLHLGDRQSSPRSP